MKRFKVLLDFLRISVANKIELGRTVQTRLTGNAYFTVPDPAIAQLTIATNALETAYIAAQGGGSAQVAAMHQAEKAWDDQFRKEALYVERVANGNDAIILSSGFNASHPPMPALHPEFSAEHGKLSGEVQLKHKGMKRAAWIWQYVADPIPANDQEWVLAGVSTQAGYVIHNLEPGKKYWFRAAYVTKDGQGPWNDPAVLMVL